MHDPAECLSEGHQLILFITCTSFRLDIVIIIMATGNQLGDEGAGLLPVNQYAL